MTETAKEHDQSGALLLLVKCIEHHPVVISWLAGSFIIGQVSTPRSCFRPAKHATVKGVDMAYACAFVCHVFQQLSKKSSSAELMCAMETTGGISLSGSSPCI